MTGVPYTFSAATAPIPLSQLDANFNTTLTIGGTSIGLGNTTSSLANVTFTGTTTLPGSGAISSAGLLGIGMTPAQALSVTATANRTPVSWKNSANTQSGYLYCDNTFAGIKGTSGNFGGTDDMLGIDAVAHLIQGYTNGAERFRLDTSGNLLVGQTSANPNATGIALSPAGGIIVAQSSGQWSTFNTISGSGTEYLLKFRFSGTDVGSVSTTSTATAFNTSSDYRLKENVQPMTGGLATISALKPVNYDWIIDKSAGEGFIAHELQAVIPAAVTGVKDAVNEDGSINAQGVDFSKIVPHLVAAIQELTARLEALEAK